MFQYFDYAATFLWAISGAVLGARRGYDIVGVMTVALVSAAGGGLLRDGFFMQDGPPRLLRGGTSLALIGIAVLLVIVFGDRMKGSRWLSVTMDLVDSLGLGAYAVFGMALAVKAGLPTLSIVVIGMVNAVGGSILRDVLVRAPRRILEPGQWQASAALVGCLVFVVLEALGLDIRICGWIVIAVVFALRFSAIRFDLRSKPLSAFADHWGERDHRAD